MSESDLNVSDGGAADAGTVGGIPLKRSERDPEEMRARLGEWLGPQLGADGSVELSMPSAPGGTGVANETLMFDATWTAHARERSDGFVVRFATPRNLYLEADIERHYLTYTALGDVPDVPVPRVFGYEGDVELLGAPFFVMERIEGDVPADTPPWASAGFVFDANPEQRRAMWEDAVRVLAALHQVDASTFPHLLPRAGESGLDEHLAYWRRSMDVGTAGNPHDTLERGWEWLQAHRPDPAPTELSWGDSRFANIMFRDERVVAIFDWDTVSMTGAEADLAWWRFMDGASSSLDGIGTPDELVKRWQEHTGRTVRHLEFYDVFTTFRLGAIMLRLFTMMGEDGVIPPDVAEEQARNSGPAQALAAQLDALT
jgi:aminoglycoside phosphotransferase (APT) family kinase protein